MTVKYFVLIMDMIAIFNDIRIFYKIRLDKLLSALSFQIFCFYKTVLYISKCL